jgi:hypothetical protein
MKEKKTRQDHVVTINILKSSIGPQFQELMETVDIKNVEARKNNESLKKQIEQERRRNVELWISKKISQVS